MSEPSKWAIPCGDMMIEPSDHERECLERIQAAVMKEPTSIGRRFEMLRLTMSGYSGLGFHTFAMRAEWWQTIWNEARA